jgi:hypothetical protein
MDVHMCIVLLISYHYEMVRQILELVRPQDIHPNWCYMAMFTYKHRIAEVELDPHIYIYMFVRHLHVATYNRTWYGCQ